MRRLSLLFLVTALAACSDNAPAGSNGSTGRDTAGSSASASSSGSAGSSASSASASSGSSSSAGSGSSASSGSGSASASSSSSGSGSGSSSSSGGSSGGSSGAIGLVCTGAVKGFGVPFIPLPAQPYRVALGDVNGDGVLDAAVANFSTGDAMVMLGYGDGSFAAASTYAGPFQASATALADLDGDGALDLAIAGINGTGLTVYRGTGTGTFTGKRSISTIAEVNDVAAGDFDADGLPDLVEVSRSSGQLALVFSESDGGFAAVQRYPTTGTANGYSDMAVADLNDDGKADVAVTTAAGDGVVLWLSTGSGLAQSSSTIALGARTGAIAAGDFDGDGNPDLLVVVGGGVQLLRNQGGASFGAASNVPITGTAAGLIVGDFDGDGHLDFSVSVGEAVEVLFGDGQGGFPRTRGAAMGGAVWGTAGELNGDGAADLVYPGEYAYGLQVLLNNGDGTFLDGQAHFTAGDLHGGAVGDFNDDGRPDLAAVSGSGELDVFASALAGGYDFASYAVGSGTIPVSVVAADFDGDGNLDLATSNSGTSEVSVFDGLGDGHFGVPRTYSSGGTAGVARALVAGDFDGDGFPDLAVADSLHHVVHVLHNTHPGFASPTSVSFSNSVNPFALHAVDVNADGHVDLVVQTGGISYMVAALLNDGAGQFTSSTLTTVSGIPTALAVGDLNRDGKVDLAAASTAGMQLLVGAGTGSFTAKPAKPLGTTSVTAGMAAADFDGDGLLDVALGHYTGSAEYLGIYRGYPDAGFAPPVDFAAFNPGDLTVSDLDGNGRPDLYVVEQGGAQVETWLNACW